MQTKLTLKAVLSYLIIGILITILSFIMKDCNHKPNLKVVPNDSINSIIDDKQAVIDMLIENNKAIRTQIESLKEVKPKVIVRYKTVYDSLLVTDTTCVNSLNLLYNECQKVDSVNSAIITNQEKHIMNDSHIIGNLTDIIALKQYRITSDSLVIDDLNMTVKKEKRKGKLKTILGSALGVLAGIGIGSISR